MNRLGGALSPYLRQHAGNPVDWYEWGDEAFAAARERGVPVLLSVGYSSCHWCHVMAHESFEDPVVAGLMNEHFVNVKVDREERPDVDAVYMGAVQALTGRGGWPMTVWLTPDGRPFFAGTYFPDTDRGGLPSFRRVLLAVAAAWAERRGDVVAQADEIVAALARAIPPGAGLPAPAAVDAAYGELLRRFDPDHAGFGAAPKFPQAPTLELLLRLAALDPARFPEAGPMLGATLDALARGGIHDQLEGGFSRYSVDRAWRVPHFEKMLTDNAQLARLYLWGGRLLGRPELLTTARSTLAYLRTRLRRPGGGFFTAEDADSEGEEGRYYVVTAAEVAAALPPLDAAVLSGVYGITLGGNFAGANVLRLAEDPGSVADRLGIDRHAAEEALARGRRSLLELRSRRPRPAIDDKVLTAANGLAIRAFAEAGAVLGLPDHVAEAAAAARYLLARHRRPDGRLLRASVGGTAAVPAFLDDYAALATGLFSLYAVTGEREWFRAARETTLAIPQLFDDGPGLAATGHDAEPLVVRPPDHLDNPTPSGTSLAVEALVLLSLYTGDPGPRRRAEEIVAANAVLVEREPMAVGYLTALVATLHAGTREVAVTGPDAHRLAEVVWERPRPGLALAVDVDGVQGEDLPLLAGRYREGRTLAHVCVDHVCRYPTEDPGELRSLLDSPSEGPWSPHRGRPTMEG